MLVYKLSTSPDAGAYNPMTPATSARRVVASWTGHGAVIPANVMTLTKFDSTILQDAARLQSFRYILISAKDATFIPQATDVIKTSEGTCAVLGSTPLDPNGQGGIIYYVGASFDPSILI